MPLPPLLPVPVKCQTHCPCQCHCHSNYHFCCLPSCVHYTAATSAIATTTPFLCLLTAICKAGTYSPTGLEPCLPCEKGFYQELEGQRLCLKCGPDTTTPEEGTNSSKQCEGTLFLAKTTVTQQRSKMGNLFFLANKFIINTQIICKFIWILPRLRRLYNSLSKN